MIPVSPFLTVEHKKVNLGELLLLSSILCVQWRYKAREYRAKFMGSGLGTVTEAAGNFWENTCHRTQPRPALLVKPRSGFAKLFSWRFLRFQTKIPGQSQGGVGRSSRRKRVWCPFMYNYFKMYSGGGAWCISSFVPKVIYIRHGRQFLSQLYDINSQYWYLHHTEEKLLLYPCVCFQS